MQIANLVLVHETCIYSTQKTLLALRLEEVTFHRFSKPNNVIYLILGGLELGWLLLSIDSYLQYILVFGFCLFFGKCRKTWLLRVLTSQDGLKKRLMSATAMTAMCVLSFLYVCPVCLSR